MHIISRRQAISVWAFLAGATLATAWLVEHRAISSEWTIPIIMAVAALKSRALVLHYMELRYAPRTWRILFEAWALLVPAIITVMWFLH